MAPETTDWFSSLAEVFRGKQVICLPQDDSNLTTRQDDVEHARKKYRWRHTECGNASMIDGLPIPDELPHIGWVEGLVSVIISAVRNNREAAKNYGERDEPDAFSLKSYFHKIVSGLASGNASQDDFDETISGISDVVTDKCPQRPVKHFKEYLALYSTLQTDVVCEENQFLKDDIFGWYRIAGANCLRLMKITDTTVKFPDLTDAKFRDIPGFENDTLKEAGNSDRLYFVEYPELDGMPEKEGRFVYSPVALFAVPLTKKSDRDSLLPIAIHCKPGLPMFTPCSNKVAWIAAKMTVQTSDALTQSVMYHLGRSHLLIEVFNCAMHRSLAKNHPLHKLLLVHFYGTALMNYSATKSLIKEGNNVDKITSPKIEALRDLAARSINSPELFSFNAWMVDKELAGRGVMSRTLHYPYRDDAVHLWNAILKWARAYVSTYYMDDKDVVEDAELEKWCFEVSDKEHGNLPGFGDNDSGRITTVETLVRTVAMIIFTASAMHSATNFAQGSVMQFAPAMSLGGYTPALDSEEPFEDMEDMVSKVMPPLHAAATQMFVAEVLGTFRYTRLGDYQHKFKFAPPRIQRGLKKFNEDLADISVEVSTRNQMERRNHLPVYDYMLPSNIPQSINI